jgi:DNA end-binding protein Ku
VLRARDQVIMLETMLWADEIRTPDFPFLHQEVTVSDRELHEATDLVETLTEKFTPTAYTDSYRVALQSLVRAKIDGNELVQPASSSQLEGASDLLSALRNTVADKRMPRQRVEKARAAEAAAAEAKTKAKTAAKKPKRTPTR